MQDKKPRIIDLVAEIDEVESELITVSLGAPVPLAGMLVGVLGRRAKQGEMSFPVGVSMAGANSRTLMLTFATAVLSTCNSTSDML